jgi:outer membrane immunogenic protein
MPKRLLGSFALLVLAGAPVVTLAPAIAADMAVKAPIMKAPSPPPSPMWTGCYVGANAGWARASIDESWVANPLGFPVSAPLINAASVAKLSADSGTVGGQVGCNSQQGQFVWGGEVDLNGTGMRSQRDATIPVPARTLTEDFRIRGFGTVRARLGVLVAPSWLLYVTGGGAWANFKYNDCEIEGVILPTCSTAPVAGATGYNAANVSASRFGWTLGGGVETIVSPSWSVKAEYLYMRFSDHSINTPFVNFPPFTFANADINFNHRNQNIQTVRLGINYHFNSPVVARY